MLKKNALLCAIAGFFFAASIFAQSAHDKVYANDTDFVDNTSKFAISSPDGNYLLGFKGHLQHDIGYVRQMTDPAVNRIFNEIRRARLKIYGNAFDRSISYFIQLGLENNPSLRDYYLNLDINKSFALRFGKFRAPFARQQLISTSQMQFVDQDQNTNNFQTGENGRGIGLMFHNGFKNDIEYALAILRDGVTLRLGYNYGGIDGYETADFKGGSLRFAAAINGHWTTDWNDWDNLQKDLRGGFDYIIKANGFSNNGALYYRRSKANAAAEAVNTLGANLDFGYMVNKNIEPVLRATWLQNAPSGNIIDTVLGLNYYIYGHHLKAHVYIGGDIGIGDTTALNNLKTGLQLQFAL